MNINATNVNFQAKLNVSSLKGNETRWKNIAKFFREETKGINYESTLYKDGDILEIGVDRLERKNQKYDLISDFTTRLATLTKKGTKELLSKKDEVIAKTLAQHVKFVRDLDNNYKKTENLLDKAYAKVYSLFEKEGYNSEIVDDMLGNINLDTVVASTIEPQYKELLKLPGFKDAKISHIDL